MKSAGRRWSVRGARHCRKSQQLVMQRRKASSPLIFNKNAWDSTDRSTSVRVILETPTKPSCNVLNDSELSSVEVGFTDSWTDSRANELLKVSHYKKIKHSKGDI